MSNRRKLRHRGHDHGDEGEILTPIPDSEGHNTVTLVGPNGPVVHRVCELVASTFIGECPPGQRVEHINGDLSDDCAENLRYVQKAD